MIAILLAAALAGCLGATRSKVRVTDGSAEPVVSETTGAIEGAVTGDDQLPLEGAQVGILGVANATTVTDAGGHFLLGTLPPGSHRVDFQRLGFRSLARDIVVVAGEVARLDVALEPDIRFVPAAQFPEGPFVQSTRIECAVGALGGGVGVDPFGKDYCGSLQNAGGGGATVRFAKAPGQNLTAMVVSVKWNPGGNAPRNVELDPPVANASLLAACAGCFAIAGTNSPRDGRIQGTNQFHAWFDSGRMDQGVVPAEEDSLQFTVFVASGNRTEPETWGGVVFQTTFDVGVLLAYNGFALPDQMNLWEG